ncbi:MAG: type II secretion system protein [Planctomycetales bacterium]|nr:type II secretion system protein [bacterium]UNM08587.1 MAG: type II secretion system protein [Planctomycetales bacterium]
MSMIRTRNMERQGYSLIELLVSLVIAAIVGGTIVTVMQSQIMLSTTQNRNMLNQADLRDCISYMSDEIVTMGSGVVEPFVEIAEPQELMYVGDLNNDDVWERIHYYYDADAQELIRELDQSSDDGATWTNIGTDVMMDNLGSIQFIYYANNNEAPADEDAITAVEMKMTMDVSNDQTAFTGGRVGGQAMVGRMTIRNRRMN